MIVNVYCIRYYAHLHRLLEVRRHILLKVEVGERVLVAKLEELAELGVRKDDATIGLVLEAVCANVGGHLLGDIRARHKSTVRLAEEISELNTDPVSYTHLTLPTKRIV